MRHDIPGLAEVEAIVDAELRRIDRQAQLACRVGARDWLTAYEISRESYQDFRADQGLERLPAPPAPVHHGSLSRACDRQHRPRRRARRAAGTRAGPDDDSGDGEPGRARQLERIGAAA